MNLSVDDYIRQHTDIRYCEAIISPDGSISDASPSHIYKLIELSGKSKDEIDKLMPMYASPLEWLVDYTGCISVWYTYFRFSTITDSQKISLQRLIDFDVLSSVVTGESTDEYQRCKMLEALSNGDYDMSLINYKPETIIMHKGD